MKRFSIFAVISLIFCFADSASAQKGIFRQDNQPAKKKPAPSPSPTPVVSQPPGRQAPPAKQEKEEIAENESTGEQPVLVEPGTEIAESSDEVLSVETNLVTVPVTVLDREGRFIPGLGKEDFQVFDNGKQQEIAYFATTEQPFTVALLLDVSQSASFKIQEIQNAAWHFVTNLRPADKVLLISFADEINLHTIQPTGDRETLKRAINQTKFAPGTSLYDAVKYTLERMKKIQGRKAIVLFSDGVDTTSRKSYDTETLRELEELDVLIYPVRYDTYADVQRMKTLPPVIGAPTQIPGQTSRNPFPQPQPQKVPTIPGTDLPLPLPQRREKERNQRRTEDGMPYPDGRYPEEDQNVILSGGGDSPAEYRKGLKYLNDLALNSGGRFFEAKNVSSISTAFYNVTEELRRQYSLGYYPEAAAKEGERRRIKVKTMRSKSVVRSREVYIVGRKTAKQKNKT